MTRSIPYICPRCGTESFGKENIKRHFSRKKPCKAFLEDIELSNEVRCIVLENRTLYFGFKLFSKKDLKKIANDKKKILHLQEKMLNSYECNLLRSIFRLKSKLIERYLDEYYSFLFFFGRI